MQCVKESGGASGVKVEPPTDQKSAGQGKNIPLQESRFCEFCLPVPFAAWKDPDVYTDKYGFAWRCTDPTCPHAVRDGPVVLDCMILNRIMTRAPGSLQDLPQADSHKRRKYHAQLTKELKTINTTRAAV